jgi:pilus assembly protein CpaD
MRAKLMMTASLAFTLAGCGMPGAAGTNSTVYSTNQPVVERTNYAMDVNLEGYSGISVSEIGRVSDWFDALDLGFGDRIAIDYGDGVTNKAATEDVVDLAAKHGMLVAETAPVTAGNIVPGTARIVVTRSTASVPSCPNWSKTTESNFHSSNHPNYGCAVNGNLAAMVADPEDLVRGRKSDIRNDNGAGYPPLPKKANDSGNGGNP